MNLMTISQDDVWYKMWKENSIVLRERAIVWRKEDAVTRIERPSRLLRARRLGYKAKQGIVVIRMRVGTGGMRRQRPRGGRRPKHLGVTRIKQDDNMKTVADRRVLERYPNMNVEEKSATIRTMASRASYAQNLTDAIKSGVVPRNDLPEYIVQKMRRIAGPRFVDIWGMAKSSGVVKSGEKYQITISTIEGKMLYDIKEFEVKTGDSVSLKFRNLDFPPHNLLIVKPGKADEVAKMAIELGDKGFSKQWRPDTELILWGSTALNHKEEDLIKFIAPEPGNYPYVCTFPGHAMMMRGVMKVVPR